MSHRHTPRDVLAAGLVAAVVSGLPSTSWTLLRGGDLTEGARAAGALLLGADRGPRTLLAAAVPVHLTLSVGWAAVLARVMPAAREPFWGAAGGLAIAALDLGVLARRIPSIRALEQLPQWADHLAYGLAIGFVLRARRHA